ncbi:MAG: GNAT family N-acetyltransferase [Candidatus Azobacteroides sp.]|nr:GNAT family N-acetyltransferase [Candidatus Azobacteroides sp.]
MYGLDMEEIIRKAVSEDLDVLEVFYEEVIDHLEATVNYPRWTKGIYPSRDTIEACIREGTLFILLIEGKIAGCIVLDQKQEKAMEQVEWGIKATPEEVLIIRTFAVHPRFMGQKLSLPVMDFVREYALSNGIKTIRLDVLEENIPAIKLYEKLGYTYKGTIDLGLPEPHPKWFKVYELIL